MLSAARFLMVLGLVLSAGMLSPAHADHAPITGLPEESIASSLPYDAARASLCAAGITYGLNYTGEYYNVTSGGLSRGSTFNGIVEAFTDLDLEKIIGWKGGTVHANVYYIHGEGPTTKRIGNIFAVTNIEGLETLRLDELWFEQALLDDKLKVKLGAIAADTEFFISETAGGFLNGTFGWAGIVASNMVQGGPAYPLTSMGVRVQFAPTENLTILAAVFNGSPANPFADDPQRDNRHGTDFRFGDGELLLVEGLFKYDVGLPGTIKLGGWRQFNDDGEYVDFRTGDTVSGSDGLYAIVDQQVWKKSDNQSVNVFGRISGSPDKQNVIDFYFDTGIVFTGFVPGRSKDSFGAAFGYGRISDAYSDNNPTGVGSNVFATGESVLEINYTAQIMPGVTVIPDFQYIWNPGGKVAIDDTTSKVVEDAAVFAVRAKVSY